jgi:hypothetical protein
VVLAGKRTARMVSQQSRARMIVFICVESFLQR